MDVGRVGFPVRTPPRMVRESIAHKFHNHTGYYGHSACDAPRGDLVHLRDDSGIPPRRRIAQRTAPTECPEARGTRADGLGLFSEEAMLRVRPAHDAFVPSCSS